MELQTPSPASTSWGMWGIPSRLVQGWKNWFEGQAIKDPDVWEVPSTCIVPELTVPCSKPWDKARAACARAHPHVSKGRKFSFRACSNLSDRFFFLSLCCHPILRQDESGHIKYYQHKNISEFTGICFSFSLKRITIKFTFHINVFELFHNHEENYLGLSGEYQLCISKLAWTQNDLFTFYVSISLELIIHSADCLFKNKHTNKVQ